MNIWNILISIAEIGALILVGLGATGIVNIPTNSMIGLSTVTIATLIILRTDKHDVNKEE